MSKPIVAIVGRPNVGKSTFFNKIVGRRVSIVEDTPGVTRDRIYAEAEWNSVHFALIDTGGIEPDSEDIILSQMREQAQVAMDMADVILFITDGKEGLTSADREVAMMLMRTGKKVILVVNKIDKPTSLPDDFYDFYELGLGEPIPVSAANMLNFGDVLDEIVESFPEGAGEEDEDTIKIAVIGKPNVGKSSLMNALLRETRAIVTEIPGTTRDTIEEMLSIRNIPVKLTDTAGIRQTEDIIEKIGIEKSKESFNQSDLVLFMIDGSRELDSEDEEILSHLGDRQVIVILNKLDLPQKVTSDQLRQRIPSAVILETSLKEEKGISEIEDAIADLVYGGQVKQKNSVLVTSVRHRNLLEQAASSVTDAISMAEIHQPLEFLEIDVNRAYELLGEIIGETVSGDVINEVFARFCLGK